MKEYLKKEEISLWRDKDMSSSEIIEKLREMYNSSMNCLYEILAREIGTVHVVDLKDLSVPVLEFLEDAVVGKKLRVDFGEDIERKSFKEKLKEMAKERGIKHE